MAKAFLLLIGICAYAVQGSVIRNEETVVKRQARSPAPCDGCDSPGVPAPPPPPPPPGIPPVFHTEQWSGLTHSNGGHGVFSGAAASIDGGTQSDSQAFSLASATGGDDEKKGTVAPELLSNRFGFDKDSDSFGQSSGGDFGGQGVGFGGGKKISGSKSSFKESHFSIQSGGLQFEKGSGFKDGDIFHHQQFYTPGRGHRGFEGTRNIHGGFGAGSASQSSSFASSGSNKDDAGAIHFEGQHSERGDLNSQFDHLHSGSGLGGSSSSASSASSTFTGNQQQQSGFGSGIQGSGFGSTGRLEDGSLGFGSQNAQFGQSGSGYHSFDKSKGFSTNEQQQQQNLQIGSQRGFGSDSASGHQHSGFGSGGHFEGESSAFGSQNSHFGQSGSGNGQSNGFDANEQQQQINGHFGQLQSGSGYVAGSASSASSASSGNRQQQQLNLGSQTGFGSNDGAQGQEAGFGSAGHLTGGNSGGHYEQQGSSFNSFGNGFTDNGQQQQQQQQLQHGSQTGFESSSGSQGQGAGFGSSGQLAGESSGHYKQQESSFNSFGKSDGFADNRQQQQQQLQLGSQTGFESGAGSQGGLASGSSSSQASGSSSGSFGANQQEQSDLHTGIGGALKLAAQGLKQAQEQNSGCSTCGKSSYALSNAKSHSGSAIALSVAG
ncbi:filaggrin-2 [Papilio machaon]|uniref:filaggrin-2 n=1 Tax=Papilio machaon TaxID=76193 RepID=UPI001E664125|nr:filaggrin-2 [Papilio machaon]